MMGSKCQGMMICNNVFKLFLMLGCAFLVTAKTTSGGSYAARTSRRERSLDHWDAETLAAYLGVDVSTGKPLDEDGKKDTYVGYDAAVMFYSQSCKHCHNFAPLWDAIANILHAGTRDSDLIMSLFNCELDTTHMKLCKAAGVTHYPTLLFIGSGTFHDKIPFVSQDKNPGNTLPRTVKYPGANLAIGDAVLDWIKTMQGISTWNKWNRHGWVHWLRQRFSFPGFGSKKSSSSSSSSSTNEKALPVGVPFSNNPSEGQQQTSVSTKELEAKVKSMETQIKTLKSKNEELDLATNHAGWIIESFLFPNNKNITGMVQEVDDKYAHVDIFELMTETNVWDVSILKTESTSELTDGKILKSCVADIALDYCTRASTKLTNDYLKKIDDDIKADANVTYPTLATMESELKDIVKEEEPYCSIIASCYKSDFAASSTDDCRPAKCPLKNDSACRYVSATCLSSDVQDEYRKALTEESENTSTEAKDTTSNKKSSGGAFGMK